MAPIALSSCIYPGLPYTQVYLHRPDASTFEFVVCQATEGTTLHVEFLRNDEVVIQDWSADAPDLVHFARGDRIPTDPPPSPFVSNVAWSAPDSFYAVDFEVGKYVDGNFTADIVGGFRDDGISGTDWLDQGGKLAPARC
ncbi:MAG: hypothetical protein ABI435_02375 [Pseudolysinimonas sp.]